MCAASKASLNSASLSARSRVCRPNSTCAITARLNTRNASSCAAFN